MPHTIKIFGKSIEVTRPDWVEQITGKAPEADAPKSRLPRDTIRQLQRMAEWERERHAEPGIFIPLYLRNPLNSRRSWRPVAKDAEAARSAAHTACIAGKMAHTLPVRVIMTRYGVKKLDDGCGLNASLKPIRDGVADYFGLPDSDPRFVWDYAPQGKAPMGCNGVRVEFVYEV